MFLRQMPDLKVTDLYDLIDPNVGDTIVVQQESIEVVEEDEQAVLRLSHPDKNYEVVMGDGEQKLLAKWLNVPYKFYQRVPTDLRLNIAETMLAQRPMDEVAITFTRDGGEGDVQGLYGIREPSLTALSPKRFVDIAREVVSDDLDVVSFHCDSDEVMFEVVVPENFERHVGGDRKVGDITVGGVRFGQNRARNLAPWVQPYLLRLACTNGYETYDDGLKVDARGASGDDLLIGLKDATVRAFASIEDSIAALYDLRNEPVSDPTQAVVRLARERNIPQRTVMGLVDLVPDVIEDFHNATMFDVINVVTNAANEDSIQSRLSQRRALERAGGESVAEHVARCAHCHSRMN